MWVLQGVHQHAVYLKHVLLLGGHLPIVADVEILHDSILFSDPDIASLCCDMKSLHSVQSVDGQSGMSSAIGIERMQLSSALPLASNAPSLTSAHRHSQPPLTQRSSTHQGPVLRRPIRPCVAWSKSTEVVQLPKGRPGGWYCCHRGGSRHLYMGKRLSMFCQDFLISFCLVHCQM